MNPDPKATPIGGYVFGPLKICFPCGWAAIQQQRNTEVAVKWLLY